MTAHTTNRRTYLIIWAILLALLLVSLGLGRLPNPYVMNVLVFAVAGVKAVLVLRHFMHLRMDPWLVTVMLVAAVLTLGVLLLGVSPDVTFSGTTGMPSL